MICAFIASVAGRFGVVPACRALSAHGVRISPRTFHARRSRPPSARALRDAWLTGLLRAMFEPDETGRKKPESLYGAVKASFTLQATGSPAPTVSAVDYPSWMTFTLGNSSGMLSGTPPRGSEGDWAVYIWAENGSGFTARQTLTLTVNQPPAVVAGSHLTFRACRHVRYRITSTGFPAPVLREHGLLPRGLAFRARPNGTARTLGKPAISDKGKRYLITIIASNHIGHAAAKHVTIRIR